MTKILRVGVLTPITRLKPTAPEHETALVLKQVLETPYLALPGRPSWSRCCSPVRSSAWAP